jgi:hypothetical protein
VTEDALASRGYTDAWFVAQPEAVRTTVRVLHRKLASLDLWRFVAQEWRTEVGVLQFTCADVAELRARVGALGFRCAGPSSGRWEASERRFRFALHLKHFDGWPEDKVQAHVDPFGAWLPRAWWLFPPVPLVQLLLHRLTYDGYRDVGRLRGEPLA